MHTLAKPMFILAVLFEQAAAHGYVRTWTLDNSAYPGYSNTDRNSAPPTIGWSYTTPNEGPELDITSPDFICRQGGSPAQSYGSIAAGSIATFFWTSDDKVTNPDGWDSSHKGPILTYITPCNGDCTSIDKTTLAWTKIAATGLLSANTWATDQMIAAGGIATAAIPPTIAPGKYVLRNEIIALHRANVGQPEFYMQCGNVEVTGSGSDGLAGQGVPATSLYSTNDPQLFGFDIYDMTGSSWQIPGPPLYSGVNGSGVGVSLGVGGSSSIVAVGSGSESNNLGSGASAGVAGGTQFSPDNSSGPIASENGPSGCPWSGFDVPDDQHSDGDCICDNSRAECSEDYLGADDDGDSTGDAQDQSPGNDIMTRSSLMAVSATASTTSSSPSEFSRSGNEWRNWNGWKPRGKQW